MMDAIDFDKMGGIVPAVVQDADDGSVLMLGWMNREALERTMRESEVVFWSRSRKALWKKGETSGNLLHVVSIETDCDRDAILILARPAGPVCHTGLRSCFPGADGGHVAELERLFRVIAERKEKMPADSYTTKLFREGNARIAQKVGEEAVELVIASQSRDRQRVIEESADLFYHILVLLAENELAPSDVYAELRRRRTQ